MIGIPDPHPISTVILGVLTYFYLRGIGGLRYSYPQGVSLATIPLFFPIY